MQDQNKPFCGLQTAIPTPYTDEGHAAPHAPALPAQHVQDRMFRWPDIMRGQLALPEPHDA